MKSAGAGTGDADPGAFDSTDLDARASAAGATAGALQDAAALARDTAQHVALERAPEWRTQAMARLHGERRALLKALDAVEAKAQAYADAWGEVALSSSAEARDGRPKLGRLVNAPPMDDLRTWANMPPLPELLAAEQQAQGAAAF